jgi:hypothetical protein
MPIRVKEVCNRYVNYQPAQADRSQPKMQQQSAEFLVTALLQTSLNTIPIGTFDKRLTERAIVC